MMYLREFIEFISVRKPKKKKKCKIHSPVNNNGKSIIIFKLNIRVCNKIF